MVLLRMLICAGLVFGSGVLAGMAAVDQPDASKVEKPKPVKQSWSATSRSASRILLITRETLREAWQPFADWKTRLGKPTQIVSVEEIEKKYEGKDIQQKIRACVLESIDKKDTHWVILGGDSEPDGKGIVPDRDTLHVLYKRHQVKDIPADLYYISEKDWDANEDGVYGDWANDREAIAYTHSKGACIARIPVRTAEQVKAYTEKIISYETQYPEKSFAKKFLYTCAVPFANYKSDMYWDRYLAPDWPGAECYRFFNNKTPWDKDVDGDYDLSPAHWVERINNKTAGKMHMHGHGILPNWVLEGHKLADKTTIAQLKNQDAYLLMTTVSCFTGHYDDKKDPSIIESILRTPKSGAVVAVAPSRPGVPIFPDWKRDPKDGKTQDGTTRSMTLFWRFGLSKQVTTGEAWAKVKDALAEDAQKHIGYHWVQCELNLLGDPTLDMRASDPYTPKVTAPEKIGTGKRKIVIKTEKEGLTVCLWKPGQTGKDEIYTVATTNDKGLVSVEVSAASVGEIRLTVSGPNTNAYQGVIEVK